MSQNTLNLLKIVALSAVLHGKTVSSSVGEITLDENGRAEVTPDKARVLIGSGSFVPLSEADADALAQYDALTETELATQDGLVRVRMPRYAGLTVTLSTQGDTRFDEAGVAYVSRAIIEKIREVLPELEVLDELPPLEKDESAKAEDKEAEDEEVDSEADAKPDVDESLDDTESPVKEDIPADDKVDDGADKSDDEESEDDKSDDEAADAPKKPARRRSS